MLKASQRLQPIHYAVFDSLKTRPTGGVVEATSLLLTVWMPDLGRKDRFF